MHALCALGLSVAAPSMPSTLHPLPMPSACAPLQYDLIACFEQRGNKHNHNKGSSDISSSFSSSMAERQQATLGVCHAE